MSPIKKKLENLAIKIQSKLSEALRQVNKQHFKEKFWISGSETSWHTLAVPNFFHFKNHSTYWSVRSSWWSTFPSSPGISRVRGVTMEESGKGGVRGWAMGERKREMGDL